MSKKYKESCDILGIPYHDIQPTQEQIKRQYRSKALQFHPDKNRSPDAADQFRRVQEAYDFLRKNDDVGGLGGLGADDGDGFAEGSYASMLQAFLANVLGKGGDTRSQLFTTILQRLSSTCQKTMCSTLERLDKETLVNLYELLKKHGHVLHIHESILQHIEQIILEKHQGDECIVLNPTVDDLFENNLYKLSVGGFTYIVPLWHHELVYDNSGNDVIVKCFPMMDENMYMDEGNHLHIEVEYSLDDVWGKPQLHIPVGSRIFTVQTDQLRFTKFQTITLPKCGISIINTENVYDISKKGDVFIHIELGEKVK
jgi:hypothetical protein